MSLSYPPSFSLILDSLFFLAPGNGFFPYFFFSPSSGPAFFKVPGLDQCVILFPPYFGKVRILRSPGNEPPFLPPYMLERTAFFSQYLFVGKLASFPPQDPSS